MRIKLTPEFEIVTKFIPEIAFHFIVF